MDWDLISFITSSKIRFKLLTLLNKQKITPTSLSKTLEVHISAVSRTLTELTEKELIQNASNKIFVEYCDSYSPYNDFIRDYASMLDGEKNLLLKNCGIQFMDYYKKNYSDKQLELISNGINSNK